MIIGKANNVSFDDSCRISKILKKMFNPEIAPFLIYQDSNYPFYFQRLIGSNSENFLFIAHENSTLLGFAHFKLVTDDIFLNNIGIDSNQRNKGIGRNLLKFALNHIIKDKKSKTFSLDVFEKNQRALDWYLKIGMKEISRKYWYQIPNEILNKMPPDTSKISILKDANGFKGIYLDNNKIATIINQNLIFNDLLRYKDTFNSDNLNSFLNFCLISPKEIDYMLLDCSIRLSIEISKMKL